jgi:hypothetical protein
MAQLPCDSVTHTGRHLSTAVRSTGWAARAHDFTAQLKKGVPGGESVQQDQKAVVQFLGAERGKPAESHRRMSAARVSKITAVDWLHAQAADGHAKTGSEVRTNWVPCDGKCSDILHTYRTYLDAIFTSLTITENPSKAAGYVGQECAWGCGTVVQAADLGIFCRQDTPTCASTGLLPNFLWWCVYGLQCPHPRSFSNGFHLNTSCTYCGHTGINTSPYTSTGKEACLLCVCYCSKNVVYKM